MSQTVSLPGRAVSTHPVDPKIAACHLHQEDVRSRVHWVSIVVVGIDGPELMLIEQPNKAPNMNILFEYYTGKNMCNWDIVY
jgi:hypothetical protein